MKIPKCDFCGKNQRKLGALLFGPFERNGRSRKHHACCECVKGMQDGLKLKNFTPVLFGPPDENGMVEVWNVPIKRYEKMQDQLFRIKKK